MKTQEFLNMTGEFTWFFGMHFFIETDIGNFVWSDPVYYGDNSIKPYPGTVQEYSEFCGHFGRCKGVHTIGEYCGNEVKILVDNMEEN